ncbi:lipopolysaccharide assembly protein LapB [Pseudoalteromonas sp. P1-25]|uniref:tetratricopeptide repeat protein n=1 Tax=Pseudoalteromonas sp. P1-25 TaxID=1723758 RepID=UPI0006D65683|nr:tetratricopeptide repeat protein [Pseudoalteromonas sp. P1-25]KPZ54763.1 Anaphase-promoting complex, cyclosome, subunit 3 [Pseudoalteromonas sp. P1-25]
MRGYYKKMLFVFCAALYVSNADAEPIIPEDNDIIATSNSSISAKLTLEQLNTLVLNSQYIGQTERYQGVLKNRLAALYKQEPTAKIGYLYARVLQKEHQFTRAIKVANTVIEKHPSHVNTHLLLANMLMTQGKFEQAKQHCVSLIGAASVISATTCVLDIQSQQGQLQQSYQSLLDITQNKNISLTTKQVLSEMAFRLNKLNEALEHINSIDLSKAPVSLIVLWADIQLSQNNPEQVLNTLSQFSNLKSQLEDAVLLRLAIAEKRSTHKVSDQWQTRMQQRVNLREQRQDTFHANDLANYYIHVQVDKAKAQYWANINWQQAKMSTDQHLLHQANAMARDTL